jgi:cephalosporin hydroxylase
MERKYDVHQHGTELIQTGDGMQETERGGSILARPLLDSIQRGTLNYTYKGIRTLKNPFDWALYPMLLWETRPQTIFEIGSNRGGSALWLADTMRSFDAPTHIHSIDLRASSEVKDPQITFHQGDANELDSVFTADFMREVARPLLVIEDASHFPETTSAVLNFFHHWLRSGDYIIVEDGIVNELGLADQYRGGPRLAIATFMAEHPEYEIDARYCDWFGRNVTYAVNGFLRRRA